MQKKFHFASHDHSKYDYPENIIKKLQGDPTKGGHILNL